MGIYGIGTDRESRERWIKEISAKNKQWRKIFRYVQKEWRKKYKLQKKRLDISTFRILADMADMIYPLIVSMKSCRGSKCKPCPRYKRLTNKLKGLTGRDAILR